MPKTKNTELDPVLDKLRTARHAVEALLEDETFQTWLGSGGEIETTVTELRTASRTLQQLRAGRAFELAAEENQRRFAAATE